MKAFSVTDAITSQEIKPGEEVVAIILVNTTRENDPTLFDKNSFSKQKMASMPIHGTWDGSFLVPRDSSAYVVDIAKKSVNGRDLDQTFKQFMTALYEEPERTYTVQNSSSTSTFSLALIKPETLGHLFSVSTVANHLKDKDLQSEMDKLERLKNLYLETQDKIIGGNQSEALYDLKDDIYLALGLRSAAKEINGFPTPLVSVACQSLLDNTPFAHDIMTVMQKEGNTGIALIDEIVKTRELPSSYLKAAFNLTAGMRIAEALNVLQLSLQPSRVRESQAPNIGAIEFAAKIMKSETNHYLSAAKSESSPDLLRNIDKISDTLKRDASDLLRERALVNLQKTSNLEI